MLVSKFVFNVPPTTEVIWRRGHDLRVSSDRLEELGIELRFPEYKVSGLSTKIAVSLSGLST